MEGGLACRPRRLRTHPFRAEQKQRLLGELLQAFVGKPGINEAQETRRGLAIQTARGRKERLLLCGRQAERAAYQTGRVCAAARAFIISSIIDFAHNRPAKSTMREFRGPGSRCAFRILFLQRLRCLILPRDLASYQDFTGVA